VRRRKPQDESDGALKSTAAQHSRCLHCVTGEL
jgi:hypothetical protein